MVQGGGGKKKEVKRAVSRRNHIHDEAARCPFFRAHTHTSIGCESMVPDSNLVLYFGNKGAQQKQYSIFCCNKYENCEVFRATMAGYEDE